MNLVVVPTDTIKYYLDLVLVVSPNITPFPQLITLIPVSTISIILIVPNISNLTTNPLSLLVPTQEVVDPNNVILYIRTPYLVNSMYAPIVEPTLTKPRVMPLWHIVVYLYMVGNSSFAPIITHIILALPTDFPLENSGVLLDFSNYMNNI
jgi:hypothetical protein